MTAFHFKVSISLLRGYRNRWKEPPPPPPPPSLLLLVYRSLAGIASPKLCWLPPAGRSSVTWVMGVSEGPRRTDVCREEKPQGGGDETGGAWSSSEDRVLISEVQFGWDCTVQVYPKGPKWDEQHETTESSFIQYPTEPWGLCILCFQHPI